MKNILLITLITSTATSHASDCSKPIADCKRALDLYKSAVTQQGEVIASQSDQIEMLKMDRADLEQALKEESRWYKSKELWFLIGAGLGVLAVKGR
jgi:hypothetical protein